MEQGFNTFGAFEPFKKIPRLHGDVHVSEKIDGTNACVEYIQTETGYLMGACSRNRRLVTIEVSEHFKEHPRVEWHGTDNYGFGSWVVANHTSLVRLGYGRHFGEWYGQGIQRTYGLDHKRFALFRAPKHGMPEGIPSNVDVVPEIDVWGEFDTGRMALLMASLKMSGSSLVPGFMDPEGIVVFHARSGQLFKYTFEAGPKGQKEERCN
jgi:hypothetical protein